MATVMVCLQDSGPGEVAVSVLVEPRQPLDQLDRPDDTAAVSIGRKMMRAAVLAARLYADNHSKDGKA